MCPERQKAMALAVAVAVVAPADSGGGSEFMGAQGASALRRWEEAPFYKPCPYFIHSYIHGFSSPGNVCVCQIARDSQRKELNIQRR